MKKLFVTGLLVSLAATAALAATADDGTAQEKEVKKGWSFGVLPCATYSNDMGFQYGAFGDVYYYGDGKTYPDPLHKISWEVSHFTKGRTRYYLAYDSKYLIPNLRVTGSATYITDPLYNFWGFNGPASPYYSALVSNKNFNLNDYNALDVVNFTAMGIPGSFGTQAISYYHMKRNMLRLLADFQYKLTPNLRLAGGVSFWRFDIGDLNSEKYGYNPQATVYKHYIQYGLIEEKEKNGGNRLELKAGLVFDNRDIEAAPNKGIWSEVYVNGSPDVFGDGYNYLKLCAHWRQYISIPLGFKAGDPVFAYHIAYQGTIAGNTPFYVQQNITALVLKQMVSEGLGSSNTIRGTFTNRIIADGYAWGNFELRVKLVNFKLFGQYFYVATNPFFDCGIITQPYRLEKMATLPDVAAAAATAGYKSASEYLKAKTSEFVKTAGIGLKLAWNQNFIISVEGAHNFNKGLGDPFWLSIGVNYAF